MRRPGAAAIAKARAVVERLGLRDPEDLDIALIAAAEGMCAVARPLAREEGHVIRAGDVALASIATRVLATPHWRWVLAHELGHRLCDDRHDDLARCTSATDLPHLGAETRANDAAAELLMPEAMFEPRWRAGEPTLARAADLARVFAVPLASSALRGLLFTEAACAIVCTKDGIVTWCAASVSGFAVKLAKGDPLPNARALSLGLKEESAPDEVSGGQLTWWRR